MNKIIIINLFILSVFNTLYSQNQIDSIVSEITKNNKTLSTLNKSLDAENVGNNTGRYPQNPEVELNYLWGSPYGIGNRTDISIKQTFDFPTAYLHKSRISSMREEQSVFEYQKQLKEIELKSKLLCFDLIYYNALKSELNKRLLNAIHIADSYKTKYDMGEANILEYNKAGLNVLNISNDLEMVENDRYALINELIGLNGGIQLSFNDSLFDIPSIPVEFDEWYHQAELNNPVLNWLKKEIEINQKQEKLNFALSLPKLQTGYMSEKVVGEHYQGISVGLSLPLWENRGKTKYAELKTTAMQENEAENRLLYYNRLKTLYGKATGLQKSINEYRLKFQSLNNTELLQKSLEKGEIGLIDYIFELSFYYECINKLLQMERDLHKTIAEINQY